MKPNSISPLPHNRYRAAATWILAATAFVFVSVAVARPSGGSTAYLDGRWYHDGKPTRILVAPDGRSITITNEFGQSSDGYANGPRSLVIPSLRITGEVNAKGKRISWTNGTAWTRETQNPDLSGNLGGRWFRDGRATKLDMSSDGRNFTVTNELGMRANGYVTRSGELKVPGWLVTGQVSKNGHKISWSNGTEWTRPTLF